jgi:hypothetical protein
MARLLQRGSWAAVLILIGSTVATAFPINGTTTTTVNNDGSGAGTVSVRYGSGAGDVYSTAAGTTTFNTLVNSGGSLTGAVFRTYCIELTQFVNLSNGLQTVIDSSPPALPPPDGVYYATPLTVGTLQRAAWIVHNATTANYSGSAANIVAAAQLAIWEIVYDARDTATGDVTVFGSSSQGFLTNLAATDARVVLANKLLADSFGKVYNGLVFRQGLVFNGGDPTDTANYSRVANGQTLLAAVPEPSSLAIAGLGTLGLLVYSRRRRPGA